MHQHPVSIGCSSSHLLSASCLRAAATEPDPNCLGPPQPPEAPSIQGLGHNSDSAWAEWVAQAQPSQCPQPPPPPYSQHVRSTAALLLHLALQLSASISTWEVQFLSVGTRGRESSGKPPGAPTVANQKWQRMGGQARLKEAKLKKAEPTSGGKDQWGPLRGALRAGANPERKEGAVTNETELLLKT